MDTKWQRLKDNLAVFNVQASSYLCEVPWSNDDEERNSLTGADSRFVEDLFNVFRAYEQACGCPCFDCSENFVARALHFRERIVMEAKKAVKG
jgi:hypothetical protein